MPGNTAIHDSVVMERAMKARGYEWDSPIGEAFREGWHAKKNDKDHWYEIQLGIKEKEIADLRKQLAGPEYDRPLLKFAILTEMKEQKK